MPCIKGTSSVEDTRALNKALKKTKFPAHFQEKLDLSKINRDVLQQWIEARVESCLGFEDEIVASTAVNLFLPEIPEEGAPPVVDPRKAQIDMAGFLGEEKAAEFSAELYEMMIDASKQPMGIPRKLLEEKKKELAAKKQAQQPRQPPLQQQPVSRRRFDGPQPPRPPPRNYHERSRPISPAQHDDRRDRGRRGDDWREHDRHHDYRRRSDDYNRHGYGRGGGGGEEYDEYGRRSHGRPYDDRRRERYEPNERGNRNERGDHRRDVRRDDPPRQPRRDDYNARRNDDRRSPRRSRRDRSSSSSPSGSSSSSRSSSSDPSRG